VGRVMSSINSSIEGVIIRILKQIEDERGAVLHMLRADSPLFSQFGEIYFSLINPGVIKAWKRHHRMTQHFAVPMGCIRLVLFDDRASSSSNGKVEELILGRPDSYYLVRIPPMVWYGFQGMDEKPSLISNCTDLPHDPKDSENMDILDSRIPYKWE